MACAGEELELWGRLRGSGDCTAHKVLFDKYAVWARSVAADVFHKVRLSQLEWADYSQNAMVGLLEAIGRYDHTRGIDFIAYAKPRVRGAVFNALRSFRAENYNRTLYEERKGERLESLKDADSEEVTGFVSLVAGLAIGHLLDGLGEGGFSGQPQAVELQVDAYRVGMRLREAISKLPEKEGVVVKLHYLDHLPFTEIAGLLRLTKGRVSQLHKQAIARLRESRWLESCRGAV